MPFSHSTPYSFFTKHTLSYSYNSFHKYSHLFLRYLTFLSFSHLVICWLPYRNDLMIPFYTLNLHLFLLILLLRFPVCCWCHEMLRYLILHHFSTRQYVETFLFTTRQDKDFVLMFLQIHVQSDEIFKTSPYTLQGRILCLRRSIKNQMARRILV